MSDEQARLWEIFLEMHSGLPRQGPGDAESTRRALSHCTDLPPNAAILDIGCGPGMQTLVLADNSDAHITATDLYPMFLDELNERAAAANLADRITTAEADMTALPFAPDSFDVLWSEGAVYIMGVAEALTAWRPFLKSGGYLAFSEITWLKPDPPSEVYDYWQADYPAITTAENVLKTIHKTGYTIIGHFAIPNHAWWDDYYTPLEAKLPALRQKYADDPAAQAVFDAAAREIDICRRFGEWYSYTFFIAQKP